MTECRQCNEFGRELGRYYYDGISTSQVEREARTFTVREFEREGEGLGEKEWQVKKEYRTKGGNLGDTSTTTMTYRRHGLRKQSKSQERER